MLTRLSVYSPRILTALKAFDESGTLASDSIQIHSVEGLDPVPAAINTIGYGVIDGEMYVGSTVGKRNIVLTVGFNPNWIDESVESLRQLLYRYFMPKNPVNLLFESTHIPTCQIDGYVETVTQSMWSKEPEFQVSILCPYPYFTDVVSTVVEGTAVATDTAGLITLPYVGTVPTGFKLQIRSAGGTTTGTLIVANSAPTKEKLSTSANVVVSAALNVELSTVLGNKYLQNVNVGTGVVTNIMGELVQTSQWPQLYPGDNQFVVAMPAANQKWTMTYYARYGGI